MLEVRQTACLPRLLASSGEHREEDRRQDGDDGDHDQELYQRESLLQRPHLSLSARGGLEFEQLDCTLNRVIVNIFTYDKR